MALELTQKSTQELNAEAAIQSQRNVKLTSKDRLFFTEQLALLLDTGTNLHNGLQILSRQCSDEKSRALILDITEQITGGLPFSDALERHSKTFSTTYINLVRAGENGGFLPTVLEQLMQMEEQRAKLRSEVMSAVSYPMFLMGFSICVVVFVLVVVFPKFEQMFKSIADQLPATTKILMATSEIIRTNYIAIIAFLAVAIFLCVKWARSEDGRKRVDRMALYAPVIKSVFVPLYLVQSLRVMSLSLANGVSITNTLKACREVVPNRRYQKFITVVETTVQDGAGIAAGFRKADFMPDIVKEMVATGEETGSLPKVLNRIARYYETDLEKRLAMVARMAEPVMLVVMGLVVGILVSSLILPIFQLSSSAR